MHCAGDINIVAVTQHDNPHLPNSDMHGLQLLWLKFSKSSLTTKFKFY